MPERFNLTGVFSSLKPLFGAVLGIGLVEVNVILSSAALTTSIAYTVYKWSKEYAKDKLKKK